MFIAEGDSDAKDENDNYIWQGRKPSCRLILHNSLDNSWSVHEREHEHGSFCYSLFIGLAGGLIDKEIQGMVVNSSAKVAHFNVAEEFKNKENTSKEKSIEGITPEALKLIDQHFYVAGEYNEVGKRNGCNDWTIFSPETNDDPDSNDSFYAIDGFTETDIYVCGGDDNLWHFDGKILTKMDTSNIGDWQMNTLLCGDHGLVYIAGGWAELMVGNKDQGWKMLNPEDSVCHASISTLAQYNGKLYGMSDLGLWQWDESDWQKTYFR